MNTVFEENTEERYEMVSDSTAVASVTKGYTISFPWSHTPGRVRVSTEQVMEGDGERFEIREEITVSNNF